MPLLSQLCSLYWAHKNLDPAQAFKIRVAPKQQILSKDGTFVSWSFLMEMCSGLVMVIPSIALPTFGESFLRSSQNSKNVSFQDSVLQKMYAVEDSPTGESVTSEVALKSPKLCVLTPRDDNQLPSRAFGRAGRQYHSDCGWMRKTNRKRAPARQVQSERKWRTPRKQRRWDRRPEPELEGSTIAEMLHQIHQPKKYRYRNSSGFQQKPRHSKRNNSYRRRSQRRQKLPRDGPSAMLQTWIQQDM